MKKIVVLVLSLELVLALTGCAGNSDETAGSPGLGKSSHYAQEQLDKTGLALSGGEDTEIPPDYQALTEPPALSVSTINQADCVTASCGNYHWSIILPDGTSSQVIACGLHPLDHQEYPILYTAFPDGTLPFLEEEGEIGSIVPVFQLDFGGILPESISAIRWPASCIGNTGNVSDVEEVAADMEGDTILLEPLGDGDYIYEISAQWGEMGGGSYVFRTLPQIREEQVT